MQVLFPERCLPAKYRDIHFRFIVESARAAGADVRISREVLATENGRFQVFVDGQKALFDFDDFPTVTTAEEQHEHVFNPRDGSVYVHNGELFQAAEDLHIKGKVMDLTFRRTYLSHSLFTSSIGRNWDWMGNMRVVEMLNGDVHLMNGESQIETYESKMKPGVNQWEGFWAMDKDIPEIRTIKNMDAGAFDYASLYYQSQYVSPRGIYRSLIKGKPVDLKDKLPKGRAEEPRFYLVGKHGTIWTFMEDQRFRTGAKRTDNLADADKATEHEPIPGVRAQYLLVCIHDRRQANYIKLQRDARGLVQSVIDDHGRVTRLSHVWSFGYSDHMIRSIRDFMGRTIDYRTWWQPWTWSRSLKNVKGPHSTAPSFHYDYVRDSGKTAPRYRLDLVDATGGSFDNKPLLQIMEWKGPRAQKLVEIGKYTYELTYGDPKVTYKESGPGRDHQGRSVAKQVSTHTYTIKKATKSRPFGQVSSHTIARVGERGYIRAYVGSVTTAFKHNEEGEITRISRGNYIQEFDYETDECVIGNLKKQTTKGGATEETTYEQYNVYFNLPELVSVKGYSGVNSTTYTYDSFGNRETLTLQSAGSVTEKNCGNVTKWTYRKNDGLLESMTSQRGAVTWYDYYWADKANSDEKPRHSSGDAWDCADMLAMTRTGFDSAKPTKAIGELRVTTFETGDSYRRGLVLDNDAAFEEALRSYVWHSALMTTFLPTPLGYNRKVVDQNGVWRTYKHNDVGQVETGPDGDSYTYECDLLKTSKISKPRKGSVLTKHVHDKLGNRLLAKIGTTTEIKTAYDIFGNPIWERDSKAKRETTSAYDKRGLMVAQITRDKAGGKTSGDHYAYDKFGNMALHRDPCGWFEAWQYNNGNEPYARPERQGHALVLQWDKVPYPEGDKESPCEGTHAQRSAAGAHNALLEGNLRRIRRVSAAEEEDHQDMGARAHQKTGGDRHSAPRLPRRRAAEGRQARRLRRDRPCAQVREAVHVRPAHNEGWRQNRRIRRQVRQQRQQDAMERRQRNDLHRHLRRLRADDVAERQAGPVASHARPKCLYGRPGQTGANVG